MFNTQKFLDTKFIVRTVTVATPALAPFFAPGEAPQITIRGLTGEELARVNEAQAKNANISALLEALAGAGNAEKVDALRQAMGLDSDQVADDLARRLEQLALGSVDPAIDIQTAVKLFRAYPVVGFELTNKIMLLSGQGMIPGEAPASGETPVSASPSL